jgi:hypothetical protein
VSGLARSVSLTRPLALSGLSLTRTRALSLSLSLLLSSSLSFSFSLSRSLALSLSRSLLYSLLMHYLTKSMHMNYLAAIVKED